MPVISILAVLLSVIGAAPDSVEPARVTLSAERGMLDLSGDSPVFRVEAMAHNRLPLPVDRVEIGVLFADSDSGLDRVDPASLLAAGTAREGVGVLRQRVELQLPPGRSAPVRVESVLTVAGPPQAYAVYLLGYRLAEVEPGLLLELLHTSAAADELAAVETLALTGEVEEKLSARRRFGGREDLVAALAAIATAEPPAKVGTAAVLERIYAVRGLGVLGGETAARTLRGLLQSPTLQPFDTPLVAVGTERLRRSRYDTPLAFAVPVAAMRMNDVVAAALDDLELAGAAGAGEPPEAATRAQAAANGGSGSTGAASGPVAMPATAAELPGRATGEPPEMASGEPGQPWPGIPALVVAVPVAVVAGIGLAILLLRFRSRRRVRREAPLGPSA